MKTWSAFALRLLARILQQGALFLERQREKVEHWAEQAARVEAEASSAGAAAVQSSSAETQAAGRPPAHWLKAIAAREGPVQWIEHAGGESSDDLSQAQGAGSIPASPPRRVERSGAPISAPDGMRRRSDGEAPDRTVSPPRFAQPTRTEHRQPARGDRPHGAEAVGEEDVAGASASRPGPEARSRPARLAPMPAHEAEEPERTSADRRSELVRHRPFNRGEAPWSRSAQNPRAAVPFAPSEVRSGHAVAAEDEPQASFSQRAASARRLAPPPTHWRTDAEHMAAGRQGAPSTAPSRANEAEHGVRIPATSADTEGADGHEDGALDHAARSPWPDLPAVDQILREEQPRTQRWTQQSWERRRRLDSEQRGELWNG